MAEYKDQMGTDWAATTHAYNSERNPQESLSYLSMVIEQFGEDEGLEKCPVAAKKAVANMSEQDIVNWANMQAKPNDEVSFKFYNNRARRYVAKAREAMELEEKKPPVN